MAIQAATRDITIPAATHPDPALFLTRLLSQAAIPVIRNARTAEADDIEATRAALNMATDLYVSHVGRLMLALNENMPMGRTIDPADFLNGLADSKSDLDGLLMQAAEAWCEENGQFGVGA